MYEFDDGYGQDRETVLWVDDKYRPAGPQSQDTMLHAH
jgi:hypothetical protein